MTEPPLEVGQLFALTELGERVWSGSGSGSGPFILIREVAGTNIWETLDVATQRTVSIVPNVLELYRRIA